MSETVVVANTRKRASQIGSRLFRNNRGLFLTLDKKRKVRAGLEAPGASDLIGLTPIVITQEMVGLTIAPLFVVESKTEDWKWSGDEHEEEQYNFIEKVIEMGGIGFFLNNHEKLEDKIKRSILAKILKKPVDRALIIE